MRRPLVRVVPRRLVPPLPLLWVIALTAIGGLGFRWSLPPLPPPPPPPPALEYVAASAAPAPRHVTRSLSELGLALGLAGPLAPRGLSDYALLFGRVPKAGSELLALLLQRLQAANGFRLLHLPRTASARRLSAPEQEELVAEVTDTLRRQALPVVFSGAVYFTNFSTFDRQSPTYVSLLRDPVERAMAGLTTAAAPPSPTRANASRRKKRRTAGAARPDEGNHLHRPSNGPGPDAAVDGDLMEVLESCLSSAGTTTECAWAEPQSPYFCGHDSRCRYLPENGDWALKRAMANIDQYYPVVGVLEELNATLAVLETRLPLFFSGVRDVYRHQLREPHINWDRRKLLNFKPEIREKVQKRLALEYELYIWAKQRLMLQHFEDSQKEPLPGEAGQDRLVLSIDKKSIPLPVVGEN
ncbi:hypothetical protein ONE63_000138 [Megalurothrips usitatus]|uniref:Uronyl 2-sulfotransferase-like n=1 Tax=Megalurothrips usitatus TaxID=439358 RepID=A0AAV7XXI9_9NEOP|nr:hypothetical protein ONE63_000138 [Megalurothrips usitatus]